MNAQVRRKHSAWLISGFALLISGSLRGGSHTWDVNEVFSNADGSIQFVELLEAAGSPAEVGVPGHNLISDSTSFVITGPALSEPTSNKHYLIATQSFADLPGAPTPDAIIPLGSIPFFSVAGDSVTYQPWDTMDFSATTVPTDGITSLNFDLTTGVNSPTNYAGESGSVDLSGPEPAPAVSSLGVAVLCAIVLGTGWVVIRRRGTRSIATSTPCR
jgi:hypothetical protein